MKGIFVNHDLVNRKLLNVAQECLRGQLLLIDEECSFYFVQN